MDLIDRTSSSGTVTAFPIYDAHGNDVASLTRDGNGGFRLSDRRSYDAWGVVRAQQSGGDPKLRYCGSLGHRQDDESGLIYMRARYYEPTSGRFLSEDPAHDGLNWFGYCGNNPIDRTDATGKWGAAEWFGTFVGGCLTFFCGLYLLGWADKIDMDVSSLKYIISREDKLGSGLKNAFSDMQEAANKAKVNKGMAQSVVLKAVGYSMVISGLLIDIDLAPDGQFDILQTFFGGSS